MISGKMKDFLLDPGSPPAVKLIWNKRLLVWENSKINSMCKADCLFFKHTND